MNNPADSAPRGRTSSGRSNGRPPRSSRPLRDAPDGLRHTATLTADATPRSRPAPTGFRPDAGRPEAPATGRPSAAELARQRRTRRNAKIATTLRGGAPVEGRRLTARQIPFVAVLVALLGAGLAGVLWLNTLTDEAGIRTNQTKNDSAVLQLQIEALESDIAVKSGTPAIAAAARALGLVPAGDAAILVVPTDGGPATVVGEPTPVPDPVAEAAAAKAAADAAAALAAQQAAAQQPAEAAAGQPAADAANPQPAADAAAPQQPDAAQPAADPAAAQPAADAAAAQQAAEAAASAQPPTPDAATTTPADVAVTTAGAAG